jgi:cytochrome b6-f complex iron-sulfur subunit
MITNNTRPNTGDVEEPGLDKTAAFVRVEDREEDEIKRRDFIKLGVGALSALALIEMGSAGVLFLRSRGLDGQFGGEIKVGEIERFPPGSVTEFADGNFFLVRAGDGGFLAIYRRCPHLGCTVNWVPDQDRFYCPCHASSFDIYGDFDNRTVSRALDTFPIAFDDQIVVVDTRQLIRREHFSTEQLAYLDT